VVSVVVVLDVKLIIDEPRFPLVSVAEHSR